PSDTPPFPTRRSSDLTHSGIAASDQRLAAQQTSRAFVTFLAVVRSRIHFAGESRPRLRLALERRSRIFGFRIFYWLRCHRFLSLDRKSTRLNSSHDQI